MPFFIGLGFLVVLVGYYISTYNAFQSSIIKIDEAESGIDVALKKRFDLLTKALDVVKGYAKHESETLANIVALRGQKVSNQQLDHELTNGVKALNILVEQYPDLKANTNFLDLQHSINDIEEHLSASRRFYNAAVTKYNRLVKMFPSSVVASMNGFEEKEFYEVDEASSEDVKMSF